MGGKNSAPVALENGTYPWPKEKLDLAEKCVNSGDPRIVNFRLISYPIEDPIDMQVTDIETPTN